MLMYFLGYRKTGQRGKVVNAERWSTRKSGQHGKVVNGKLVNAERWSTENWSTPKKPKNAKFWFLIKIFETHKF
jgi:hypothetical protein